MTYYLLLAGDTESDVIYDTNIMGEESFGVFYPSIGFHMFQRIVNQQNAIIVATCQSAVDFTIPFSEAAIGTKKKVNFKFT